MRAFLRIFHDLWLFVKIVIKHGITNAISSRAVYILGTKIKHLNKLKKQLTYSVWAEGSPPDSLGVHYDLIHPGRVTSSVGHVTVPHLYTPSFVPHITILSKKPEGRMGGSKNWNILKKLSYEFKNCLQIFHIYYESFLKNIPWFMTICENCHKTWYNQC